MAEEKKHKTESDSQQPYLIAGSIVLAGIIIAFAVLYKGQGIIPSSERNQETPNAEIGISIEDAEGLLKVREGDFVLGNPSAPVTFFAFEDFQCPFCGRFYDTTVMQLKEKYIKSGQVKFVWRDFAFLGQESIDAAQASRCAGEQDKFWEYHDYLFSNQNGENVGVFSVDSLKSFAKDIGLNETGFNDCLDSGKYQKAVIDDTQKASKLGISGTPTSVVNGQMIVGAQPFSQFEALIESALK